jgi:hypothetical protein
MNISGQNRMSLPNVERTVVLVALVVMCLAQAVFAAEPKALQMGKPELMTIQSRESSTTFEARFPVASHPEQWNDDGQGMVDWNQPRDVVDFGDGSAPRTLPISVSATIAVPSHRRPLLRVTGWTWLREPNQSVDIAQQIQIEDIRILRGVPLVHVRVLPEAPGGGVLSQVTFQLDHNPAGQFAQVLSREKTVTRPAPGQNALANPDLYQSLHYGLATAPTDKAEDSSRFAQSTHWLRLEITDTGVHRLSGFHTGLAGMNNEAIDPTSFRMFQAWPIELPFNPEADGSWQDGWDGLTEVAIDLSDATLTWGTDDELLFYAVGPDAWLDRIDTSATRLEWRDHLYSNSTVYWLTWEELGTVSTFPAAPLRVSSAAAAPNGVTPQQTYLSRRHFEQSNIEAHGRLLDGWSWSSTISLQKAVAFHALDAVAGMPAFFRFELRSNYLRDKHSVSLVNEAEAWLNQDQAASAHKNWTISQEDDSLRFHLAGWSDQIVRGDNQLTLQRNSTSSNDPKLILDSADIMYWADLDLQTDQIGFGLWGEHATGADQPIDLKITSSGSAPLVWDVTDPTHPIKLIGNTSAGQITYGTTTSPGLDRHYQTFDATGLLVPEERDVRSPHTLRAMNQAMDYIIIHAPEFSTSAQRLGAFRSSRLPGYSQPNVAVVNAVDIYDAFGGGVRDPLALRNFLKWVWGGSEGRLASVCFFGDSSRDYRNYRNIFQDLLPSWVRVKFPSTQLFYSNYPYGSDDILVSFDMPPTADGLDTPDLACGRLTVQTPDEARRRVDQILAYDLDPVDGVWRNRVVMAADDLTQPSNPNDFESEHTSQAEYLINSFVPETIDVHKVHLVDFEKPDGVNYKPQARQAARKEWNDGLTIFHYIGHGSDNTLADEQLFLTDDIYGLSNGMKRGVFMAFSCDVGIYDQVTKQSMAETFVSQDEGAAIGAIAASQVSWVSPNNLFSNKFYEALFPGRVVDPTSTLGQALWLAKVGIGDDGYAFNIANSQRYHLFCDPMLSLPHPAGGMEFHVSSLDSLRGGRLEEAVVVLSDHGLSPGTSVSYDLLVQEAREDKFEERGGLRLDWWLPGATTFRGTGVVQNDTLRIPFKVPLQLRYGDHGKVRLILDTPDGSFAAAKDLTVVQAATGVSDDVVGPAISMAFEDRRYRVKPGTLLEAVIADTSGVSILGTNPLNSVLIEFDNSGVLNDVSDTFEFDPGSFTTGRLLAPMPDDLKNGEHLLALYASDVLGNVGSDTLSFMLVPDGVAEIFDATVFPNPTPGPNTWLALELSDPMTIDWTIYTVAGNRVWSTREVFSRGGRQALAWDGRDTYGDELANGVYMYVLKGHWSGDSDHPITQTGQIVIMK